MGGNQSQRSFNTVRHSNRELRKQRRRQGKIVLLSIYTTLLLLILTAIVFGICAIAHSCASEPKKKEQPVVDPTPTARILYETVTRENVTYRTGTLLVVNQNHAYRFPSLDKNSTENMVTLTKAQDRPIAPNGTAFYQIGGTVSLQGDAKTALDEMLLAYYEKSGDASVKLTDGFRTYSQQETKYGNNPTQTLPPGYSDHHTGYLLNFSLTPEEQEWLNANCWKYGFIQRYPQTHKEHTGVMTKYDTCYRYVGNPHAAYIVQNGLCLEEYVDLLRTNYAERHLAVSANGVEYEVYYVPTASDDENGTTLLQVPKNYAYTISGDNIGGFIVTVNLDQPVNKTTENNKG